MSKVSELADLLSQGFDGETGPWVTLSQIHALGIFVHSRRVEDVRKLWKPLGFDVENKTWREGKVTRSSYRKVRDSWRARLANLTQSSYTSMSSTDFQLTP